MSEQPEMAANESQRREPTSTADIAGRRDVETQPHSGQASGNGDGNDRPTPLLAENDAQGLQSSWEAIQVAFVDRPRAAVADADALVADVMQRIASSFADERASLETRWNAGDDVSTEDLRQTLQRYRSFFRRLLTV